MRRASIEKMALCFRARVRFASAVHATCRIADVHPYGVPTRSNTRLAFGQLENEAFAVSALTCRRRASTQPAGAREDAETKGDDQTSHEPMYVAPLSQAVRRVKMLSISSCAATVIGSPIIVAIGDASGAAAKLGIAGTLLTFGVFTTAILHVYTKPYIHKLWMENVPKESTKEAWDNILLKVERIGLFANRYTEEFKVGDTEPYDGWHPLGTFARNGKPLYLDKVR